MNQNQDFSPISAALVAEADRLKFLPLKFGRAFMRAEALVYAWMRKLSPDYAGGFWDFFTLDNGGFYLAPDVQDKLRVQCDGNWFDGEMSADAAGIVASLFAVGQLVHELQGVEREKLCDAYYHLRAYASEHPESELIMRAID